MTRPTLKLEKMLANLDPLVDATPYCFILVSPATAPVALGSALGTFREQEGVTAIVPESVARELGDSGSPYSRITLQLMSPLDAVGLTSIVSSNLAEEGISCNVVAAFHHEHLFVPWKRGFEAVDLLRNLQKQYSTP